MNFSVRQLRAFVEVAHLASFTRAAERVHVTQAGLSAMIRELEAQLGARLFERTTRSVMPTSAGRALLPSAERVLAELERARERIARIDSAASARVAVTALIAAHVLPPVIARLHAAHPGVALDIVDAGPQEMQRMVERDEVDLALGAFLRPAAGIERTAVFRFGLALATLPSHPGLAQRIGGSPGRGGAGTLPWQRLRGEPLIGLAADNLLQQRIDAVLARHGIEPSIAARFNTLETVLAMAAAGIGSAIVPTFTRPACRRYGLRMIGLRAPEAGFDFYRISRKGAALGPAVALLIGLLREEVDAVSER